MTGTLSSEASLNVLRAAGEETRLRILALLADSELTVSDLTRILGQSQPRISRHLKLLVEAELITRVREGSWAYYRLTEYTPEAHLLSVILEQITPEDTVTARDKIRLAQVREERADAAADFFARNASDWDRIRSLHVDERTVEAAIIDIVGDRHYRSFVDLGTGTGRMLTLLGDRVDAATGFDQSREMLGLARAGLDEAGVRHCRVQQGNIMNLPLDGDAADLVVIHQVLHFLENPSGALREAARVLGPGGDLVIVDFAPHENDFLREQQSHLRLGFQSDQIVRWLHGAGLSFVRHVELRPDKSAPDGSMSVSVWLARDPRPAIPAVAIPNNDVA